MTHVIVGAGPAGVIAADTLRKVDPGADVVLVGGEPEPPYSRMAIPYYLTGKIEEQGTYLRSDGGHYDSAGINYLQSTVEGVDAKGKSLKLAGGGSQAYGSLLIATGASPIRPPIEGLDQAGVHHCWTLEDARNIIKLAGEDSEVVLIGAGFIACIILEALAERGVNLTVVETQDRMVPRMMNPIAGNMVKRWCEGKGITVKTSTMVTALGGGSGGLEVQFDKGDPQKADLVVVAAGVASNTGFLDGSGIKVEDGIVVDDRLATGVDGIYAAGDCAKGPEFGAEGWQVHAIQPTAVDHGRIAAMNMAGGDVRFGGSLNMNVLDTVGLVSASFGNWEGVGGDHAEAIDEDGFRYMRLEFDGEHLIGALSLGRTENIGVLRGLIQTRVPLGGWVAKLKADPHRIVEAYVAGTQ